jgi:membrane associated rhomboid family serine protease
MKNDYDRFKFSPSVILWPLAFVLLLWVVYWVEVRLHIYLNDFGILPRTLTGLRGIILSPFLHGNLEHLYNNSIPLFVLVAALRFFYRKHALQVIIYGIVLSGAFTWLIGREGSYHIGASGLIYALVSFIFFKGIQTGYYRLVALSMLVTILYGGMVWYVFPGVDNQISWEGHLGGFLAGMLFSRVYEAEEYQKPIVYDWQRPDFDATKDPFMKRFDANGRFVNPPKPEDIEVVDYEILSPLPATDQPVNYIYVYVPGRGESEG